MKRTKQKMLKYGERDFDLGYIEWGFTNRETQVQEAQSILDIVGPTTPLRILDFGCGIGAHAIHWAQQGHHVTALDISATFIEKAITETKEQNLEIEFVVGTQDDLHYAGSYDVVTCIDFPYSIDLLTLLGTQLEPGGWLFFDVRNPMNPEAIRKSQESQTWEERDGVFHLQSHRIDQKQDKHTDIWITIDPEKGVIDERFMEGRISDSRTQIYNNADKLLTHGFSHFEFRTIEGTLHEGSSVPYWLWCVARR